MGSHTVALPTDNIKRRPSHIYIAPKVPAQPHARPKSGLSYEIRKRAQQTWSGPAGAVALHTTGETRTHDFALRGLAVPRSLVELKMPIGD